MSHYSTSCKTRGFFLFFPHKRSLDPFCKDKGDKDFDAVRGPRQLLSLAAAGVTTRAK